MIMTKNGISVAEIQGQLNHERYEPVLLMMYKLRLVMGTYDKYDLQGIVELDNAFFRSYPEVKE